jgi:pyrimidine-nucleoside phosphorylase
MLDLICDKRKGKTHSTNDINWLINNLDHLPDYQLSAWLMAVCLNGLNLQETTELTRAMAYSGHVLTLQRHQQLDECYDHRDSCSTNNKLLEKLPDARLASVEEAQLAKTPMSIPRHEHNAADGTLRATYLRRLCFVDKHSTGGVGDKVSLVLSPLLASIGFKISKFSGRSLGHTGGTIDKLEAIPGFRTDISMKQFEKQIADIGIALAAQTLEFAPADKKLYKLRDQSGTVESIPLIASSVMSKKIAGGADIILLDVKCGSGAFMKDLRSAEELAKTMKAIGDEIKLKTKALITNMDQPLGYAVGNSLELQEAIEILEDKTQAQSEDFRELVLELAASIGDTEKERRDLRRELEASLKSGKAYVKFSEWVEAQGGNLQEIDTANRARHRLEFKVNQDAYISTLDAYTVGHLIHELGYKAVLDNSAGIILHAKIGDKLKAGDTLFTLQGTNLQELEAMQSRILEAYVFSKHRISKPKLILKKYLFERSRKHESKLSC